MNNWNQGPRHDDEVPPYSRIFVVCNKQFRMEDIKQAFDSYGHIEDVHMPRDRNTGESKGMAYIKYSKTSSAAHAIKEMHLKILQTGSKPIRVMVATHRSDNYNTNDEKYKRLFIKVHKETTENEIRQHFSEYAPVDSVYLQRDKATDECRGFAYVNFQSFLDAAKAYEGCDKKYKAIFAKPKEELKRSRNSVEKYVDNYYCSNSSVIKDNYNEYYSQPREDFNRRDGISSLIKSRSQDYDSVFVKCSPHVPQKYIERLFNIIPGMTQCKYTSDLYTGIGKAFVTYSSEKSASYAVETLNNFEFPSGEVISVKPDDNPISKAANNLTNMIVNNLKGAGDASNPDLKQLADVIAQASTLLKAATTGRDIKADSQDSHCSVALPPAQPLVNCNSKVAQRCFLVFKPHPPPVAILKDIFCRFGDLIDVSTFPNKTFGFAKYATTKAAQEAIKTLHGAIVAGIKMKVLEADEKPSRDDIMNVDDESSIDNDTDRKRMKLNDGDQSK